MPRHETFKTLKNQGYHFAHNWSSVGARHEWCFRLSLSRSIQMSYRFFRGDFSGHFLAASFFVLVSSALAVKTKIKVSEDKGVRVRRRKPEKGSE